MLSMQSRTKKSTLVLLGCLALAGLASCSGGGSSGSRDDDMKIYPPPENRAPVAVGSILDQTVAVGGTRTWNTQELEPYFRDPDGDTLTYTFEFVSGASLLRVISDGSGNELLAVRGLAAGTATVRVTASDPGGLTAQQDLGIRVEAVAQNRAPEAVGSIPDQTVAVGGTKTWDVVRDLQPYFRDPDGDALTYTFQFAHYSGVLSDPTKSGSEVMVRGLAAGTSTVRVTASDGELSAVQRFTLRVEAEERNRAPEAVGSIPDQTVAVGGTRTWNAQELEPYFRDPDGDTLTYTFEFVSGASLLRVTSDGSGNELLAVRGLAAGTATVRVTARDPDGLTAQQDLDIQVQVQTAIDITGRQSVEGQIDSPDDSVLYSFRIDEPSVVTFQTSSDFEITVYDSEGNVLQTSPVVEDDRGTPTPLPTVASVPGERVVPILIGFAARAAGTYLVRVALSRAAAAAARRAAAQGVRFATRRVTLATAKVAYQIRRIARFAEVEVGLADGGTVDYKSNFEGNLTGITWSITPEVRTRWGSLRLTITNEILRLSPPTGSRPACGNQRERSQRVTAQLSWSWRQLDIPLSDETPIPFLVNRDKAPRRIQAGSWEISATVPEGGSETVSLTDYIEDPDGGPLTFTLGSVPSGLGVTRDGARLTIRAQDGAADGAITVTATDEDGECWNFPVQVTVTAVRDESCRGYPPGFTWDPFLEECNCYPLIWDWVVGTCA